MAKKKYRPVMRKARNGDYRPVDYQIIVWRRKMKRLGLNAKGEPDVKKEKTVKKPNKQHPIRNIFSFGDDE